MEKLSEKQWKRQTVLARIERGDLTMVAGAAVLGMSVRNLRRLRSKVERKGAAGLQHGNSGRHPSNRLAARVMQRVVTLARGKYLGFNDQHFSELLEEREGLRVSRATVQRVLRAAGVGAAKKRRPVKHRRRRERKPQAGQMVLWDGSRHEWLEGRGPVLSLMAVIDDATSEVMPGAHFLEQETTAGYLRLLRDLVAEKGVPDAVYGDRHASLKRNDDHWTMEEELRGEQDPTHVGLALRELAIEQIHALSPQAKGRVERLWGTLQDRLVSELRLAKVKTLAGANAILPSLLARHNRRFKVTAANAEPAWRPLRKGTDLSHICSLRYAAVVGNDNAVRIGGHAIDIPPGPNRRSYAKANVEVSQALDGAWSVRFRGAVIATKPAEPIVEITPLRRRKRSAASRAFRRAISRLPPGP
jgi:transposase